MEPDRKCENRSDEPDIDRPLLNQPNAYVLLGCVLCRALPSSMFLRSGIYTKPGRAALQYPKDLRTCVALAAWLSAAMAMRESSAALCP